MNRQTDNWQILSVCQYQQIYWQIFTKLSESSTDMNRQELKLFLVSISIFLSLAQPASKLFYLGERSESRKNARASGKAARGRGKESL